MTEEERLGLRLKRHYGRLLGELLRIEKPPKRVTRLIGDRQAWEHGAEERAKRAETIKSDLPYLAHVIRMFDPSWVEADEEPIRPNAGWVGRLGSTTIGAAAMDVLREANCGFTVGELAREVADRHDIDVSTSAAYQKVHTAVNNGLKGAFRDYVKSLGGEPERFARADLPDES